MYAYPQLTPEEQLTLPRLIAGPQVMQSKFEDSTHRLWYCKTEDGPMVLKVCHQDAITKSNFWLGMNQLFGLDFPNSLGQIINTYTLLSEKRHFTVPEFVAAKASRFVLTRFLPGTDMHACLVTDAIVLALAKHIAGLHQLRHDKWGSLTEPARTQISWSTQLQLTLQELDKKSVISIPVSLMREVLAKTKGLTDIDFVPIMLDLRWDQFRFLDNATLDNAFALVDLDAFVIGPRALELVLLEYVLTASQFELFKRHYSLECDWPDYSQQKPCYQLLLFLMNVLGERDLDRWMAQH
jgi:hypothetical protein